MLEIFFATLIKWLMFAKGIRPLLDAQLRGLEKWKMLNTLHRLRRRSFTALAADALQSSHRLFDSVTGNSFLSPGYLFRLMCVGGLCGFLLALCGLVFVADGDRSRIMHLLSFEQQWLMVICPAVVAGALMCAVDFSIAHTLVRWGMKNPSKRGVPSVLLGLPIAYLLWGIGAGLAASLGPFLVGQFFLPGLLLNRIWVAWTSLGANAASFEYRGASFTFGLLSASVGLSTMIVVMIFLITGILSRFPKEIQSLVAWPYFQVLRVIAWFDRRQINIRIGLLVWIALAALFFLKLVNR